MPPRQGDSIETLYVDIAARADQLIQDADEAVQEVVRRLEQLERKNQELEQSYSRLGNFMRNALSTATGMIMAQVGGNLTNAIIGFGRSLIETNAQLQMYERSFETLTGSAEEAGEIIEWVKEQAKETPFDVAGLIEASQRLMTWGLDIKEWFAVVGDTAAAMNRPLSQVVNAIGTLASGQTGEAVRRFRDLGINLREYEQLEFDAQGSLVTPLEEAIPVVRQIMIDRFGGMMESQSETWAGVMSNMGDTWQQFVQVVGEPIFDTLNDQLGLLYEWVQENEEAIENFARDLGGTLSATLNVLMEIVNGFGRLIDMVNELIAIITGTPDWVQEGIATGRKLAGLFAGGLRGAGHLVGGVIAGEGLDSDAAAAAALETIEAVSGVKVAEEDLKDTTEDLADAQIELNEAQRSGVQSIRAMGDAFGELSDREIVEAFDEVTASQVEFARQFLDSEQAVESLPPILQTLVESNRDLIDSTIEAADAYTTSRDAMQEMRAEQERLRAEQEANVQLASEVALKLSERVTDAMEDYQDAIEDAVAKTEEAITDIEAKAEQARIDALSEHQDEVARMRDEFAREQLRRRRRFNLEWARLIRDQQQEVLDAEWEYEFQKRNLLIEGDEIALAELEARYEHEKEVRAREQQDARDDTRSRFDLEEQERQERFDQRMRELDEQLQRELEAIREKAQEEVAAKKQALEERLADEEEKLNERLQRIGGQLAQETEMNQTAANIVIDAWRRAYGDQVVQAIQTGIVVRQEMESIMNAAIAAASAVSSVGAGMTGGRRGPRRRGRGGMVRHQGGYSPGAEMDVTTAPGEYIIDAPTTRMLEQATGGPLTQQVIRELGTSRRVLDVNLQGDGLPADVIDDMRRQIRDLTDALMEEAF